MHPRQMTCALVFLLAILVGACGASSSQGQQSPPPSLRLHVVISTTQSRGMPHTYDGIDATAVGRFYQHVLALKTIPPTTDVACRASNHDYAITFFVGQTMTLQGAIPQCLNIIQLSDHTQRGVDDAFWSLLSAAVGQPITPQ